MFKKLFAGYSCKWVHNHFLTISGSIQHTQLSRCISLRSHIGRWPPLLEFWPWVWRQGQAIFPNLMLDLILFKICVIIINFILLKCCCYCRFFTSELFWALLGIYMEENNTICGNINQIIQPNWYWIRDFIEFPSVFWYD